METQNHIFEHMQNLSGNLKNNFEKQVNSLNIKQLNEIFSNTINKISEKKNFFPPNKQTIIDLTTNKYKYYDKGINLINKGMCGIIILAGGSGSRLGFDLPKGFYVCPGLTENLFQIYFKRLQNIENISNTKIKIAIMTSDQTDEITKNILQNNNYYGLDESQIYFFKQSSIPSFTTDGKIIIEDNGIISMSPNGNGDVYFSFKKSGIFDEFLKCGIKYIQISNIDNILSNIADPAFFGLIDDENTDLAVKTINKLSDYESVGVFGLIDNKLNVIEYSEIGKELAEKKNSDNERLYNCANIGLYVFNLQNLNKYIEEYEKNIEYHIANKKIKCNLVAEKKVDGIKLELFIFDIFKYVKSYKLVKVLRSQEYSPIKNKNGLDSPETAVQDLIRTRLDKL
jgi:UDP-N-acetylglucosamine pyrophosphorylase